MNSRILIVGAFRFPDGDAAAARVLGVAEALRMGGYQVEIAGWEECGRKEDLQQDGTFRYKGFPYVSQGDLRDRPLSPVKRLVRYLLAGGKTLHWLKSIDKSNVNSIITYQGGSIYSLRLAWLCRVYGIKLFFDCVEWYDPRSLVGGRFGIVSADNELKMRVINPLIGRGIVISSYLDKYYTDKRCRVIQIPPLIDSEDAKWGGDQSVTNPEGSSLQLIYAGQPGKKDLLGNAILGLRILQTEGYSVILHIVGPAIEDVANTVESGGEILKKLGGMVVVHGRVRQNEVPKLLAAADFSILLRPHERYAEAGFSTKLVESLASGLPVIANPTGDISKFIHDGVEGILLSDHSPLAFVSGVKRALALTQEEKQTMRRAARLCATKSFDFRCYSETLAAFIKVPTC